MAWDLKQKAQDHIVSIVLGLIVLLLLVIWQGVPSSTWDRVSEATPKRVLWALLALESIAIIGLAVSLYKKVRKKRRLWGLGVVWDLDYLKPLCPTCDGDVTLFIKQVQDTHDILQCPKCKIEIPLVGDTNQHFHLYQAKDFVQGLVQILGPDLERGHLLKHK